MIDEAEVLHIAKLGRLSLDADEARAYTAQLDRILGFFGELAAIDTTGVPVTTHPLPLANAFRLDEVRPSLPLADVLANAPQPEGDYFRVPRILEA